MISNQKMTQRLEMAASLMEEAASLLEEVGPEVLEKYSKFRYFLCDELGGAAGLCRDTIAEIPKKDSPT